MLKKVLMLAALATASLVSFEAAQTGAAPQVKVTREAEACDPSWYPWDQCACGCCYACYVWGSACPACGD